LCTYPSFVLDLVSSVLCQELGWEERLKMTYLGRKTLFIYLFISPHQKENTVRDE